MSIACTAAPRGSRPMEVVAWLGLAMGLVCFGSSALAGPPRHHYASALPSPESITAYATAICGAVLTAANTLFVVWHKLHRPPRKPRKRKKDRNDGTPRPPDPAPAPAAG